MDTLLKNAVSSIQVGVEDYKSEEPKRALSAVRNISAGTLLLFKEKLRLLSPLDSNECFVKAKIVPYTNADGLVKFRGAGKTTVNVNQIREHFKALKVEVNWSEFESINELRNDIEHYFTYATSERMKELIADTFKVIVPFIKNELKEDPAELLGVDAWGVLLEVSEIYDAQLKECMKAIALMRWPHEVFKDISTKFRCADCHSPLIKPLDPEETDLEEIRFHCYSCNEESPYAEVILEAADDYFSVDFYIAMTDGEDAPVTDCTTCGNATYVFSDMVCVYCGKTNQPLTCIQCGAEVGGSEEEPEDGLCLHCRYVKYL